MDSFFSTLATLGFISVLIAILAVLLLKKFSSSRNEITQSLTPQVSIQTVHANILNEIKNVTELATTRVEFNEVVDVTKSKTLGNFKIPFSTQKLLLSYSGMIVCGCDLEKINMAQSFFNDNHLKITLPNCKILDYYVVPGSVKIHTQDSQIFADKIDLEFQDKAVNENLEMKKQAEIDRGILSDSNEKICQILNKIVAPMGIIAEINFVDERELPPPTTVPLLHE